MYAFKFGNKLTVDVVADGVGTDSIIEFISIGGVELLVLPDEVVFELSSWFIEDCDDDSSFNIWREDVLGVTDVDETLVVEDVLISCYFCFIFQLLLVSI